jgi:outer membrane protein
MPHVKVSRLILALGAASGTVPAGCSNPLFPEGSDYGRRLPAARLRDVPAMPMRSFAKPPPAPDAKAEDPLAAARQRFEGRGTVELTLAECRASALERNLDLRVALVDPAVAAENISQQEAQFEATFTTRARWSQTDSPTASSLQDAQAQGGSIEPGVTIPLRTGGTATVSLPWNMSDTNNQFSTLNPAYTADVAFSLSHPLLRNAGRRAATTAIRIASYNSQISQAQTTLQVIRQLSATDRAYWNVYGARRALEVAQQQYELAQAQLERAERQVRAGRVAEIEVIRAQAGVAERLDAIIRAQNTVLTSQRELKRLVNRPGLDVDSGTMVVPASPPDPVEYVIDPPKLVAMAEANRMELLELELQLLADMANIRLADNQTLPDLSLDATYRINGLGGSTSDAFESLRRNRFEDWSVGASLSIPLGNEGARSRLRQAVLSRLQRIGTRDSRLQTIRQEVLDAVDRIDAGWQRILASRQSTVLSARTLQAEQRQFDVGASTTTNVLDAATRLAEAQLAELQAIVDYQVAQIDLAAATGTLLGADKVRWEPIPAEQPVPSRDDERREEESLSRGS